MGMEHFSHGDTQDEVARLFRIRVKRGDFVEVGKDKSGNPLYQLAETLRSPLKGLQVLLTTDVRALPYGFTIQPSR